MQKLQFCPVKYQLKQKVFNEGPASSALFQWCSESWGEPAGTPEEDRQRCPAAQGPSDAGAGGGVKSTYSTTSAMDFYGFHIPLLVVSGFCNTVILMKRICKARISLGCHCVFWYNWHYNQEDKKKDLSFPASQARVKERSKSYWGEDGLPPYFSLDFTCCLPSSLLTHLHSYLPPSPPLVFLPWTS